MTSGDLSTRRMRGSAAERWQRDQAHTRSHSDSKTSTRHPTHSSQAHDPLQSPAHDRHDEGNPISCRIASSSSPFNHHSLALDHLLLSASMRYLQAAGTAPFFADAIGRTANLLRGVRVVHANSTQRDQQECSLLIPHFPQFATRKHAHRGSRRSDNMTDLIAPA